MNKASILVCAAIGFILVASIIALNIGNKPSNMPEGSPARTVQIFLEHVSSGNYDSAHNSLSTELKKTCAITDFVVYSYNEKSRYSRSTFKHLTTQLDNLNSVVLVEVIEVEPDFPIGTSENSDQEQFDLVKENGNWKISQIPSYSYPINCRMKLETLGKSDD
jgi:hypothetical protein